VISADSSAGLPDPRTGRHCVCAPCSAVREPCCSRSETGARWVFQSMGRRRMGLRRHFVTRSSRRALRDFCHGLLHPDLMGPNHAGPKGFSICRSPQAGSTSAARDAMDEVRRRLRRIRESAITDWADPFHGQVGRDQPPGRRSRGLRRTHSCSLTNSVRRRNNSAS